MVDDTYGAVGDISALRAAGPITDPSLPFGQAPEGVPQGWYDNYMGSAAATEKAGGYLPNGTRTSPFGWLTGSGHAAAVAQARAMAPDAYFKSLQNQSTAQTGQMDAGQTAEVLRGQGIPVNPYTGATGGNRPVGAPAQPAAPNPYIPRIPGPPVPGSAPNGNGAPAALPPVGAINGPQPPSFAGSPPNAAPMSVPSIAPPQAAPSPVPPTQGGPTALPMVKGAMPAQAPAGAAADPLAARRAFLMNTANAMAKFPKFQATAIQMMEAARKDIPPGTDIDGQGRIVDQVTRQLVTQTAPDYAATNAGKVSGAQANAALPAELTKQNNQAANTFSDVVDANGNKSPISNLNLRQQQNAGAAPNRGLADNPYRAPQIKQTTDAQTAANDATSMQANVDQLGAAIKQFGTSGPWAQHALDALRGLNQVGLLDKATSAKVSAGELANMDSNSVAAGMARQMTQGGRMLAGVFNQVVKMKPSILSSNPTLALEALHQDTQRAKDMGEFVPKYYADHANANKIDALTAFNKAHPIDQYQSRVIGLPKPSDGKYKAGYGYQMKDGNIGVYNGRGFTRYNGFGQ